MLNQKVNRSISTRNKAEKEANWKGFFVIQQAIFEMNFSASKQEKHDV